jgi:hypothetical protein
MDDFEQLKKAVNELKDIEALKQLKARYCHLVDARRWGDLGDLFAEDATCDYGFFGTYNGRNEIIQKFFGELTNTAASFMCHMVHNPLIELSGDTASASWYLTAQTTIEPTKQAVWVMGVYHDEFRRVAGAWKFAALKFDFWYYTPYEQGWARTPMWEIPR